MTPLQPLLSTNNNNNNNEVPSKVVVDFGTFDVSSVNILRSENNCSNGPAASVSASGGLNNDSSSLLKFSDVATATTGTSNDSFTNGPVDDSSIASTKSLGILPLAVLIFYSVSGGPFGCEAAVRAAGPFYTLLGFLIMPMMWSCQEALITAELGAMYPEASGGVAWVQEAFGQRAGWMAGYLGWVAGATDNAIYPVLFLDYLLQVVVSNSSSDIDGDDGSGASVVINPIVRFALLSLTSIVLAYINWLGLSTVGNMSLSICALSMSPFVVMVILGAFQIEPSRWFELPETITAQDGWQLVQEATDDDAAAQGSLFPLLSIGGVLWRPFLNNLFWNLNSFDAAASFAGDVHNPGYSLPRALFWGVVMVVLGYFVPMLVALGATDAQQHEWVDGYFAVVAKEIGGQWLSNWVVFAAGIANIALFQAELSADAFQLMGMADRGLLPKIFSVRSKHGTPTYGIILGTAVIVVLGVADLEKLIEMLNFNYSLALLMEYASFFKLRIMNPDASRPFKIPFGSVGCFFVLFPAIFFTLVVMALASPATYLFSFATNVIGLCVYYAYSSNGNAGIVEYTTKVADAERDGVDAAVDGYS